MARKDRAEGAGPRAEIIEQDKTDGFDAELAVAREALESIGGGDAASEQPDPPVVSSVIDAAAPAPEKPAIPAAAAAPSIAPKAAGEPAPPRSNSFKCPKCGAFGCPRRGEMRNRFGLTRYRRCTSCDASCKTFEAFAPGSVARLCGVETVMR